MLDLDRVAVLAQSGDRRALERLIATVQPDVWRFCAHLTRPADADDLAQDALLRVVAHLGRWSRGPVHTWILGVARNVCFEHLRRRDRRRTDPTAVPPVPALADPTGAIDTWQLLDALPIDQREALVLTQLLGLPYADAAVVTGCPIGTIRSRVARGRDALADALRHDRTKHA